MRRSWSLLPFRPTLAGAAVLLFSLLPVLSACAAKETPIHIESSGGLPSSGRVVIRSGLAWMNEDSALFRSMRASLVPLLQQRGLTVVEAPPSALSPMPGPRDPGAVPTAAELGASPRPAGHAGDQVAADAAARQTPGKPLKLPAYTIPSDDAKLPPSVLAVVPVDPMEILFARSQVDGMPLLRRGGRIPGRIPAEVLTVDPGLAEYTLVVRATMVRPQATVRMFGPGGGSGGIGGVSTLGYGAPAPSAPPAPAYGGSPVDYAKGYEGAAPNDTWGRQNDMLARDYMTKYGPQPQYATPPNVPGAAGGPGGVGSVGGSGLAGGVVPGVAGVPGAGGPAMNGDPIFLNAVPGGVTGFAVEMECYDLGKVAATGKPVPIWSGVAQRRADQAGFAAALPEMLRGILEKQGR